jgi:hypothetical protein
LPINPSKGDASILSKYEMGLPAKWSKLKAFLFQLLFQPLDQAAQSPDAKICLNMRQFAATEIDGLRK